MILRSISMLLNDNHFSYLLEKPIKLKKNCIKQTNISKIAKWKQVTWNLHYKIKS